MRIGIYFTSSKNQGGVYSYSISILEALARIPGNRYIVLSGSPDIPKKFYSNKNFQIIDLQINERQNILRLRDRISYFIAAFFPFIMPLFYRIGVFNLATPIYKLAQQKYIKTLNEYDLDLVFYPSSSNLSFLTDIPSVVTVHDLQHRINPQFKEVSAGGRWENREYTYSNISKTAFKILVDSQVGKEDLINFYKTDPDKVVILPYLAPSYISKNIRIDEAKAVCKNLGLPEKFIFYPANFWPHKNHLGLVRAIYDLKKKGKMVNLVLTGSKEADFSSFNEVSNYVKIHGLAKQVLFLGYVDNNQISAIYKASSFLIMPTFFGPTNIPILEAWVMGTPVITSDIRGCRDQLGKAGLLINPESSSDMAKKIWRLYNDDKLQSKLIRLGKTRVSEWTFSDFSQRIDKIIKDFKKNKNVK